ncbi:MAG: 1-deoxy-D-xylulose-5-phosphate synthase [candidate division TA06 bacterium ADurb.Bin417]|uniref:1-deoxy-D-xylulose-5-phosphate synthase n=1 Tax=candidate division TA06 bacterium ADurb.Bin417 TaxID=1852828 RepID=A0A1V5MLB0_UNCT6|nr:MAG: 1-deoxy-D-xylulose-5-phosphate synthase [candidate division TA06 bacterium ADurb.Bin417]
MILEKLNRTGDIKSLAFQELPELARELRQLVIQTVSETGGHLASNLGVVELTIILHRLLDLERDAIIWDVGHQCYIHKILTGRRDVFPRLRTYRGLSGFPDPNESPADPFRTGHSSTSISTALGLVAGGHPGRVVAVIGDASLGGGVAFEGLNQAAASQANLCVVLNANDMAISRTTGGVALSLTKLIANHQMEALRQHIRSFLTRFPLLGPDTVGLLHKLEEGIKNLLGPAALFESIGFRYFGPFDGHNLEQLQEAFKKILDLSGPRLIHVVTRKGRGYGPAEKDPESFHSTEPFEVETGRAHPGRASEISYRDVFSRALLKMAADRPELVAVTAAMARGTGLEPFRKEYPERFFDVGIAEQSAVAFAAGLARAGKKPVVAIYSTFFQRAFDQVFQEVCLQGLPVVFVLSNNGLVGEDGPTHHGLFTLAYLRSLPGLRLLVPGSYAQLEELLAAALSGSGPTLLVYPKDRGPERLEALDPGARFRLLAAGSLGETAREAVERLRTDGLPVGFIPVGHLKPLDEELLSRAVENAGGLITAEENVQGGFGSAVLEWCGARGRLLPILNITAPDRFVTFGRRRELLAEIGLDAAGIYRRTADFIRSLI